MWYERAAKQGNVDAMLGLAVIYGHGQGVPQDKAASFRWLVLASTQQLAPEDAARIAAARDDLATAPDRPADRGGARRGPQLQPQAGIAALSTGQRMEAAADLVHRAIGSSPQISWPLLSQRVGAETWVKHENHLPTGAFKVRGGLTYIDHLRGDQPDVRGVIAATRGNHGQSIAFAARAVRPALRRWSCRTATAGPKNAAMRAYGAELIETGHDFQAAYEATQAHRGGAQAAFRALVPPLAAGRGCDLRLGTDAGGPGPGDDLCADRVGIRHLLHHPGARCPWAPDRDRRRRRRQRRRLRPVVRRRTAGFDQQRRHHRRWRGLPGAGRGCVASDLARRGARDPGQRG